MTPLVLKDLRHHARVWIWSLLVAVTGATFIGLIIIVWGSLLALGASTSDPEQRSGLAALANILGSNLVTYTGLTTAIVIASTLGLTVAAQQRSHALWKVLGIPGGRIRRVVTAQVALVGLVGGAVGSLLAPAVSRWYLLTWRDVDGLPADMPVVTPLLAPVLTTALTTLFCILGGRGAARHAGAVPEMQALREATAPQTRTRIWQWLIAALLLIGVVAILQKSLGGISAPAPEELEGMSPEEIGTMSEPRASDAGPSGLLLAIAALCVPRWTLRPLLIAWTRLVPSRFPAWFAARANTIHRSAMSLTTIVPFAIATSMTGTIYASVQAGRALGEEGAVNGFLVVAAPIFAVTAVGGVANIAMVGSSRRQEGALLGVLGATEGTVLRATVLEGAIYAVTGVLFGLITTAFSASAVCLVAGRPEVLAAAMPWGRLVPIIIASLVLAVATTWLPAALDRRPALERLRRPV